jgi:hypothetical protein
MARGPAALLAALAAFGCNHLGDRPAVIAEPGPASSAELRAVLAEALGPRDILIAPDALTRTSFVTLGSAVAQRDPIAGGRDLGVPERFDLVLTGDDCYLVHASTGRRYRLERTRCVPLAAD